MLEWNHSFSVNSDGILGLHFFNQDNDNNPGTQTTPFIPNYNTNRFSFFLIENLKFGKNFFELGLRIDNEDYNVRGREVSQNIFRDEHSLTNTTFSFPTLPFGRGFTLGVKLPPPCYWLMERCGSSWMFLVSWAPTLKANCNGHAVLW